GVRSEYGIQKAFARVVLAIRLKRPMQTLENPGRILRAGSADRELRFSAQEIFIVGGERLRLPRSSPSQKTHRDSWARDCVRRPDSSPTSPACLLSCVRRFSRPIC